MHQFQSNSLQRHAIDFGEWMTRASLARGQALGYNRLRPAHARLMVFLAWEGSRISDIARAQDVSLNAVGQVVSELEDLGFVERVADPHDGRAKIVRYTQAGLDLLADALAVSSWLDAQVEAVIGAERLAELRTTLAELCEKLPQPQLRSDK
ncbi:MarR family transcriptional regulator [Mycobacterium alsense]|uniref:MarR family transcriptional regulator n=2 Tax=Mycobacterium alsense TaxID=324058 RepID=A0AA41XMB7_9MYCO|nr:winged helix-turn-helix transcriptional regulator [Mycobacterium alsense]OQZ93568.1 MarR family transcriptional regulator [Mycobacterium alsense]